MTLKGLIFDFDGLILDTESPEYQAWQEIYQQHNVNLNIHDWALCVGAGVDAFDPVANLEMLTGKTHNRLDLINRQRDRSDYLGEHLSPLPGVKDLLEKARSQGLKIAIASSSDRFWVIGHLNQIGLADYFDCVLTRDDVNQVKPDPELYLSALKCLQLEPADAVAFEDSPNGITAARAAGLFCVAVPNPITRQLVISHASLILDSLEQVRLEDLNARITS